MKDKWKMIVFILVLGGFFTTALVAVNYFTTPIIERNAQIALKSSILQALSITFEKGNEAEIERKFSSSVEPKTADGQNYYMSEAGVYAFLFEGPGLWGPIRGVLALEEDMATIKRITIIQQEETPGLGSRIGEEEYLAKFSGKEFSPELISRGEGKADEENEVDAITGATLSSTALVRVLNNQYDKYKSIVGSGK